MFTFLKNRKLRKIAILAIFYAALSFAYSFIGFIHPEPSPAFEFGTSRLLIEILGHFVFGFVAAIPLLDFELSALTGALAVLIDSDHILSTLNLPVSGRPDHSILYALVSLIALVYIGTRLGLDLSTITKLAFIAPITVLSHVSYDVFAGTGASFPLFVPFDFGGITLPDYSWLILEGAATILSIVAYYVARKYGAEKLLKKEALESKVGRV